MDPATLMLLMSTVTQAAGTATQIIGQRRKYEYSKQIADYNSQIALQNAKLIMQGADLQKERGRKYKETFTSKQRALYAKAGVRSTGSAFDVMVNTAAEIELDLQIDYFNSQIAARREVVQAGIDKSQADMFKYLKFVEPLSTGIQGMGKMFQSGLLATRNVNQPTATRTQAEGAFSTLDQPWANP